jgi:hypothetical protein
VVSFTHRLYYTQGKSPWYPLDRRLGGSQSRSGRGDEKNSQLQPGLEPPIVQPADHRCTTELSRVTNYKVRNIKLIMVSFLIQFRYFIYLAPTVIFRPICVGPCRHIVARPRVTDAREGLQIWRVAANILNEQ